MSMTGMGSVGSVDVDQLAPVHSENESLQSSLDTSSDFDFIFPMEDIEIAHVNDNDAEANMIDLVRNSLGDLGSEVVTMSPTETSAPPDNFPLTVHRIGQQVEFSPIVGGRFETTSIPPPPLNTAAEEDLEEYENETRRLLEDYKCPICLDTLINTVKVDCSSGHKFCNYCIKCWTRYERQVVTECPVCRGSILQRTSDPGTDAEVSAIFERFSERTKTTRLQAVKERVQLERDQSSYRLPTFFPMEFRQTPAVHVARDEIAHQNLTSLFPLLRSTLLSNHRTTDGIWDGIYDRTFGGPSRDNVEGSAGGSIRHQFQQQQQDQPEAGGLFHGAPWSNFLPAHGTPTANLSNATNTASSPGIFSRNSAAEGNEIRYQHYQYQNQEQPYNLWNNNLYLSPEEIPSSSAPYINSSSDAVWSGYNYQPSTTPRCSVNAGIGANNQSSSVMGLEAQGNSVMDSGTVNSHGHQCHHHHHRHAATTYCPAVPPPTGSLTTTTNPSYGHYPSAFSPPSSSSTCSIAIQSPPTYQPGWSSSEFNNYSPTAGQKHCHITGPQMPSPPPPFRRRVSLTSTTCVGSNVCCNFMPSPQTSYSMSATGPVMPPTSPPSTPPCNSPRSTTHNTEGEWEYPTSPRSQMANEGVGRSQQRACYTHCQQDSYPPPPHVSSTSNSRGCGLFLPSGGATSGNTIGCQGHNTGCPSHTQTQVSTCPILSNGSFFAGGFPLYSPRSGFIGFHISHHNHPTGVVADHRQVISPVAPGRITHPIVSLVPLNPDGSSTQVSLTFEVHSPHHHQPHGA